MRERLQRQLAALAGRRESPDLLLHNVVGPVSPELAALVAEPAQQAAVLLPVIERTGGPSLLLTERSPELRHHPGQVSFPGGRIEPTDASPTDAALREAHEEVGLEPAAVDVLGTLGRFVTGTGFAVTPVVGLVTGPFDPRPDPAEVSDVFEVPLEFLAALKNRRTDERERFATRFLMYEYDYRGKRIWGATATIIVAFLDLLNE
jgi:8-oxo-dGTP pyrophosphatase MutT (NUDIX family)